MGRAGGRDRLTRLRQDVSGGASQTPGEARAGAVEICEDREPVQEEGVVEFGRVWLPVRISRAAVGPSLGFGEAEAERRATRKV